MIATRPESEFFERQSLSISPDMQWPFIISICFHLFIVIAFSIGMPFMKNDDMVISPPISIEIVDVSEITQTTKVAPPKKVEKKPEAKPEESKPKPAKMTAEAAPDLTQPKAPDIPEPVPTPSEVKKPEPIKPKPVTKKPEPQKKAEEKVTKKVEKDESKDFSTLLKNLAPEADNQKQEKTEDAKEDNPTEGMIAKLGDTISMSEQDALRRQLGSCWNVMAGAKYAEELVVMVRVYMNPDRTVKRASILDTGRYNRDQAFKAAADAAIRALRNPKCIPLELPPNKYEQWKVFDINFDPRDML